MPIDLAKIQDSPHLLDILLQMEDVLDSLDVYVFKNWYLGEIAEGPVVRRYWLDFTLKYPYDKMPDPKAALRLLKHGIRVDFWKAKIKDGDFVDAEDAKIAAEEKNSGEGAPEPEGDPAKDTVWLVRISIPRRLAAQMSSEEMDFYDDDVDTEDVEDAQDTGIDDESAYMTGEGGQQGENQAPPPEGEQPPAPPGAPQ
jgi:hypothetical protein